jgi:segregation and condensation protein B
MSLKLRVEAALFLTDKPLTALAAAQLVNADVQLVRQAILELIHDYEERNSALEIADDGGYMMQIKDEYATIANDIAPIDLPVSVVRTLSAIAIKQPVLQSEIVRIRGAGAYEHIKELLEKELIIKKEEGRSALLSTTKQFQEYFRLSQDAKALRYQLTEQKQTEDETEEARQLSISDQAVQMDEGNFAGPAVSDFSPSSIK